MGSPAIKVTTPKNMLRKFVKGANSQESSPFHMNLLQLARKRKEPLLHLVKGKKLERKRVETITQTVQSKRGAQGIQKKKIVEGRKNALFYWRKKTRSVQTSIRKSSFKERKKTSRVFFPEKTPGPSPNLCPSSVHKREENLRKGS